MKLALINRKAELPINLEGYTDQNNVPFKKGMFLFTPIRWEYLFKVNGKKQTFQNKLEMTNFLNNSLSKTVSFEGIICYCGFLAEKTECDKLLDLNGEVKYLIPHTIKPKGLYTTECNKFISNINKWVNKQNIMDSRPFWVNTDEFTFTPAVTVERFIEEPRKLSVMERFRSWYANGKIFI